MSRKTNYNTYKEFHGQNYLEVKYADKDFDQVSIDEAWEKYHQNVRMNADPGETPRCHLFSGRGRRANSSRGP